MKELLEAAQKRRKELLAELSAIDKLCASLDGTVPSKRSRASNAMKKAWETRRANASKAAKTAKKAASLAEAAAD